MFVRDTAEDAVVLADCLDFTLVTLGQYLAYKHQRISLLQHDRKGSIALITCFVLGIALLLAVVLDHPSLEVLYELYDAREVFLEHGLTLWTVAMGGEGYSEHQLLCFFTEIQLINGATGLLMMSHRIR